MLQNVHSIFTWNLKIIFIALFTTMFIFFFIFRINHTKTFAVDVTKKKKKKEKYTQIFERAIVQLATSNLDFDISFNQIQ